MIFFPPSSYSISSMFTTLANLGFHEVYDVKHLTGNTFMRDRHCYDVIYLPNEKWTSFENFPPIKARQLIMQDRPTSLVCHSVIQLVDQSCDDVLVAGVKSGGGIFTFYSFYLYYIFKNISYRDILSKSLNYLKSITVSPPTHHHTGLILVHLTSLLPPSCCIYVAGGEHHRRKIIGDLESHSADGLRASRAVVILELGYLKAFICLRQTPSSQNRHHHPSTSSFFKHYLSPSPSPKCLNHHHPHHQPFPPLSKANKIIKWNGAFGRHQSKPGDVAMQQIWCSQSCFISCV